MRAGSYGSCRILLKKLHIQDGGDNFGMQTNRREAFVAILMT